MQLNSLRMKPGEYIRIGIGTEVSISIKAYKDKLEISGPSSQLSKTATVSTKGMGIESEQP